MKISGVILPSFQHIIRSVYKRVVTGEGLLFDGVLYTPMKSFEELMMLPHAKDLSMMGNIFKLSVQPHTFHQNPFHDIFDSNELENGIKKLNEVVFSNDERVHAEGVKIFLRVLLKFKIIYCLFLSKNIEEENRLSITNDCIKFFRRVFMHNTLDPAFAGLVTLLEYVKNKKGMWGILYALAVFYAINGLQQASNVRDVEDFKEYLRIFNGKKILNVNFGYLSMSSLVLISKL